VIDGVGDGGLVLWCERVAGAKVSDVHTHTYFRFVFVLDDDDWGSVGSLPDVFVKYCFRVCS
jgi:hypothetical protein